MKKVKYRNNNYNNQVYSINYKFDSISPAGKCSGTALDLIKRYNELAKEAHSNGDYVEAEVFRQYAEHYRKIITEINERKNVRFNSKENEQSSENPENVNGQTSNYETETATSVDSASSVDTAVENVPQENSLVETKPKNVKKTFTIIDASAEAAKHKKYKPRTKKAAEEVSVNE